MSISTPEKLRYIIYRVLLSSIIQRVRFGFAYYFIRVHIARLIKSDFDFFFIHRCILRLKDVKELSPALLRCFRGDDGRDGISLKMRYAWSSATQYAANDAVVYKGVMYFAKTANIANAPDEYPSIWGVLFDLVQARIFAQEDEPTIAYDGLIWFDMEGGN